MSAKTVDESYPLNWLRWLIVAVIVCGAIAANSIYSDFPLIYRAVALLVCGVLALWIAVYTAQGSSVWAVVKESQTEVRKVVWPTRQEANQTTLIVVVLVVITAFILWGLDTFFGWIASLIIG